jgi:hypothetical protein
MDVLRVLGMTKMKKCVLLVVRGAQFARLMDLASKNARNPARTALPTQSIAWLAIMISSCF